MKEYQLTEPVDACVIGAGIGGIMARLLAEMGLSVVVLELGPHWNPLKDFVNDPYVMEKKLTWTMPVVYSGDRNGRGSRAAHGVGGRMNWWGAVNIRFRPSVFLSKKMQGFGHDWPITYEELVPYYQKAERALGVSGDHTKYPVPHEPFPLPAHPMTYADQLIKEGFDALGINTFPLPRGIASRTYGGRPACNYCGFCLWGCPINAKANPVITHVPRAIAAGAEVRTRCNASQITVGQNGRINGVRYFNAAGNEQQQKAKMVILACGSPLSARLLLNSASKLYPNGLANNSGQVGRNVLSGGGSAVVWGIYEKRLDAYRGFGTITSHDFFDSDSKRGFVGGYMIITKSPGDRKLEELVGYADPGWGTNLKSFVKDFFPHCFGLQTVGTGVLNERDSIQLDAEAKDEWGLPFARINIYDTENDRAMRLHAVKTLTDIHRAAGASKIFVEQAARVPVNHEAAEVDATIGSGECRMGSDPKTSVVNSFGQAHEVKNLFLLDASINVTGAPCEPTLTLIALAYRAADYIGQHKRDIAGT